MSTHIPYSVKDLYDMAKERYDKDEARYIDTWYNKILDQVKKGYFNATLEVDELDSFAGVTNEYVMSAIDKIKIIFKGVHIDKYDDGRCPYFMVFWDLDTVKHSSKKEMIMY